MSIQNQVLLSDSVSQLQFAGSSRYNPESDAFTANSIEVLNVDEIPSLGDIITPRFVGVRLLSGDDLLVGFDDGTYEFRLTIPPGGVGESLLLRLDVEGLVETSTVTTVADVAGSLNDKYFTLADRNGEVKVVITNDGATALTSTGRVVVVTISNDDTDDDVALAIVDAFAADEELTVACDANVVTFTDKHTGTRTNVAAGDSGFSVNTVQGGGASQVIHLKSTGTSQVLFSASPN